MVEVRRWIAENMIPENILILLRKVYGAVEKEYTFDVRTHPDDFEDTQYYDSLKKIYEALQNYRKFKNLVNTNTLPRCDSLMRGAGFILEWDERQHFTLPRKIALELYPENLKIGFEKKRWIELCGKIHATDNDRKKPYRDEQRAWYDTLKDFLPEFEGLKPTIRLYYKDPQWSSLNPNSAIDIERFKELLQYPK